VAKDGRKPTTPRRVHQMVRKLARNPHAAAALAKLGAPAIPLPLAEQLERGEKQRAGFENAAWAVLDSIGRGRATPARLPQPTQPRGPTSSTGLWMKAEVERMREDGEIPDTMRQADVAKKLHARLHRLARGKEEFVVDGKPVRAIKLSSIVNILSKWGLWPTR
jgi:hypothetical protein